MSRDQPSIPAASPSTAAPKTQEEFWGSELFYVLPLGGDIAVGECEILILPVVRLVTTVRTTEGLLYSGTTVP